MTIAFDAFSSTGSTLGASNSWTHTPVSTDVRALILTLASQPGTTDHVTSVTYGGVALSHVALSPHPITAGAEDGFISGYFLGTSIPQGAQTAAVNISTASTRAWRAGLTTVTAAAAVEVENTAVLDGAAVTNPSVTLATTPNLNCFIHGILYSGQNAITGITASTNYTESTEFDLGSQVVGWMYRTNNSTGGDVIVNWTAGSAVAGIMAIALNEIVTADTIIPLVYHFRQEIF